MPKAVLSFLYSDKIVGSHLFRSEIDTDYYYIINTKKHVPFAREFQFMEYYDCWKINDEAISMIKETLNQCDERLFNRRKDVIYNALFMSMLPVCIHCLFMNYVRKNLMDRGYSDVMIIDPFFYRNKHIFEKNRKQDHKTQLKNKVINMLRIVYFIMQYAPQRDNIEFIVGMYNSKQAYEIFHVLLQRLDRYDLMLHGNRPPIPELLSFGCKVMKRHIRLKSLAVILRYIFARHRNEKMTMALLEFCRQKVLTHLIFLMAFEDSLKKYPNLKVICGTFEAGSESPLLYNICNKFNVKLVNFSHGLAGMRHDRWKKQQFHYDILMGEYWKQIVDHLNKNDNLNLGSIDLDCVSFRENEELEKKKGKYKILTLIGTYFGDQCSMESCKNHKTLMLLVRDALIKRDDWFLVIRPRLEIDQYNLLIDEVFQYFPRNRLLIDIAHEGCFSLSEILSYSDCCVMTSSSAVFECIKMNVPVFQMHFDEGEFYFPELPANGLTTLITSSNREYFSSLFSQDSNGIEEWLRNNKPHDKNWKEFITHDDNETTSERIIDFVHSITQTQATENINEK